MTPSRQGSSTGTERFSLPAARERWLEFLALEHATLPLPIDFQREGDDLLVRRAPVPGRPISDGRIPADRAAGLLLQACGLFAFLQAFGFWLSEEDLVAARQDRCAAGPRLWLTATPRCVGAGGPGPAPSAVLAAFLHRLFARGRRIAHPAARALFDRMLAGDAPLRRAEFWLAGALRGFRELAEPSAAGVRVRTLGFAGSFLREPSARALLLVARAHCDGRRPFLFSAHGSGLTPGDALGSAGETGGVPEAAKALREKSASAPGRGRTLWIAVEPARWDFFSRHAFEAAARSAGEEVEVATIEGSGPVPRLADEWRREVFVPCGTLTASLRFYEAFAERARGEPAAARSIAESLVGSPDWAAFAADSTGDAPLPAYRASALAAPGASGTAAEREVIEALAALDRPSSFESLSRFFPGRPLVRLLERLRSRADLMRGPGETWRLSDAARSRVCLKTERRRSLCLRWAAVHDEPGRRIELLLDAGEVEAALEMAEAWLRGSGVEKPERWFGLSARLSAEVGAAGPAWLGRLEAEREIAGGLLEEAGARLAGIAASLSAPSSDRQAARLRSAEILALRGRCRAAGGEAAAWRRDFRDASPIDRARALRLEANARAREGESDAALELLDLAQREEAAAPLKNRLETALTRASVYSRAGRFREEKETYDGCRAEVLASGDDRTMARLLAHEALGLSDRREFAPAIARLEEVLAVLRDDPAERAQISIDLASTLYHAGRTGRCGELLEEAMALGCAAGREDLVRVARVNRVELSIHCCEWENASRDIAVLLAAAEGENDDVTRLIGLHQRGRVAMRRGFLDDAQRDNADARALVERLSDRLEIGELWLEEGDRALYCGDIETARAAWENAAKDPPDRCDTDAQARERLRDLACRGKGGPPESAVEELSASLARGDYTAAERAARWKVLFELDGRAESLYARAEEVLTSRGGAALARHVFGDGREPSAPDTDRDLRALRDAVAGVLAGEEPRLSCLEPLGLTALAIRGGDGREVLRLASRQSEGPATTRSLRAGSVAYELELWPSPSQARSDAIALLLETLLYRAAPADAPAEFAGGWRRLGVVTADASMEEPYRRLVRFAPQTVTVLVLGDSGCGKEGVARALHRLSPRYAGPFVAVNVPTLPAALLESELFGHARGAFTGADHDRRGLLEEAQGGTIFFDEIGDMSLSLQAKLLRALQEREIRRVGENRSRAIDVRVVSATSRPLAAEVERGAFREDLYYRLHVAVIALPPLRERGRDAVLLAGHFLAQFARDYGRGGLRFSPEALAVLAAHGWPGNVRELQNAVAQAVALADPGGVVTPDLLPRGLAREGRAATPSEGYRSRVNAHRRDLISEALDKSGGNRTRAARDLGLSRQALLYLIRELNVTSRPRGGH